MTLLEIVIKICFKCSKSREHNLVKYNGANNKAVNEYRKAKVLFENLAKNNQENPSKFLRLRQV